MFNYLFPISSRVETSTSANGKMVRKKERENFILLMELSTKDCGRMTN